MDCSWFFLYHVGARLFIYLFWFNDNFKVCLKISVKLWALNQVFLISDLKLKLLKKLCGYMFIKISPDKWIIGLEFHNITMTYLYTKFPKYYYNCQVNLSSRNS